MEGAERKKRQAPVNMVSFTRSDSNCSCRGKKKIQAITAGLFVSFVNYFQEGPDLDLGPKTGFFSDTNLQLFILIEYPEKKCL